MGQPPATTAWGMGHLTVPWGLFQGRAAPWSRSPITSLSPLWTLPLHGVTVRTARQGGDTGLGGLARWCRWGWHQSQGWGVPRTGWEQHEGGQQRCHHEHD